MHLSRSLILPLFFMILFGAEGRAQTSDSTARALSMRAFAGDSLLKSPWGAVARSFLIPGWGQLYNDAPKKSIIFMVTDVSMLALYFHKDKNVQRIEQTRKRIDRQLRDSPFLTPSQESILKSRFNNLTSDLDGALNDRNLFGWFFALSHLLGMVDAYVDAHLFQFDDKMNLAVETTGETVSLTYRIRF